MIIYEIEPFSNDIYSYRLFKVHLLPNGESFIEVIGIKKIVKMQDVFIYLKISKKNEKDKGMLYLVVVGTLLTSNSLIIKTDILHLDDEYLEDRPAPEGEES